MIQEYIPLGQRVEHFSVETLKQGQWVRLASATTIGYKRILQTPRCTSHAVRITLDSCRACPVLNRIGLYPRQVDTIRNRPAPEGRARPKGGFCTAFLKRYKRHIV